MNIITAQELKAKIDSNDSFQLIDVREDHEYEEANIGGTNIPLDNILDSIEKINTNQQVVFCCKSGKRSKAIIYALERKHNLSNLYSLDRGVEGYLEMT